MKRSIALLFGIGGLAISMTVQACTSDNECAIGLRCAAPWSYARNPSDFNCMTFMDIASSWGGITYASDVFTATPSVSPAAEPTGGWFNTFTRAVAAILNPPAIFTPPPAPTYVRAALPGVPIHGTPTVQPPPRGMVYITAQPAAQATPTTMCDYPIPPSCMVNGMNICELKPATSGGNSGGGNGNTGGGNDLCFNACSLCAAGDEACQDECEIENRECTGRAGPNG